jgi:5-methylcytosine-specific restriction endonuclease McrA
MMDLQSLSDKELTERLQRFVVAERGNTAAMVAHLAEFGCRRLYETEGHSSLFIYCTKVLKYSEDEAYKRIHAARAARHFPSIIRRLEEGKITLNAVVLLSSHLTPKNYRSLLDWACGKSRRELEKKVADLAPQAKPSSTDIIRHLGLQPAAELKEPAGPSLFDSAPACGVEDSVSTLGVHALVLSNGVGPMAGPQASTQETSSGQGKVGEFPVSGSGRVRFGFTGSEELLGKIDRARQILRHKFPTGHLEDILGEALEVLLERKDPERKLRRKASLRSSPPRRCAAQNMRRIPQRVKDEVWERDGGRCAFFSKDGTRCGERGGLEFDHIVPFALGGPSHDPGNIRLLCRGHNQIAARRIFGEAACRPSLS